MKLYTQISVIAIFATLTFFYSGMASAEPLVPVTLNQKIEPRFCIIDKIADFDGTTYTINTTGCGTVVYPADGNTENGTRVPLAQQVPISSASTIKWKRLPLKPTIPFENQVEKLENPPVYIAGPEAAGKRDGFLIFAKSGSRYLYRLYGDNPILEPRFFEVKAVQKTAVNLIFQNTLQTFSLQNGQSALVDVGYDKSPDIIVQVEQLPSISVDGVLLRVSFPWQQRMNDVVFGTVESLIAMVLIGCLAAWAFILNIHHRKRTKHLSVSRYWRDIQHT